jgi:hypothetical protein
MIPVAALLGAIILQDAAEAVPLSGRVLDSDGQPVAGVEVWLSGIGARDFARPILARTKTDADGRFRLIAPNDDPSQGTNRGVWVHQPDKGWAGQAVDLKKPPAAGALELKMAKGPATTIRVLGPDGKPVPSARVSLVNLKVEGGFPPTSSFPVPDELAARLASRTDASGQAMFDAADPESWHGLMVEATGFGKQYASLSATEGNAWKATLGRTGKVAGRVSSDDSALAKGVTLRLLTYDKDRGSYAQAHITTDENGRFEVADLAAGDLSIWVMGQGSLANSAPPQFRGKVEGGHVADVVVKLQAPARLRTIDGVVADRDGQGLAGVTVWQTGDVPERTEVKTDAQGRYQLPGVSEGKTFLFARKEGHLFLARPIGPEDREVKLVLSSTADQAERPLTTLPSLLPHDEELALARKLLGPHAERALKEGDEGAKIRTLEALARVEPAKALDALQNVDDGFLKDMIRSRVVGGLLDESLDEALAIVESMSGPAVRAMDLLKAAEALPESQRARKLELIDRALVSARTASEPTGINVLLMGSVARHWLDMGEADRARDLLRQTTKEAEGLPNAAWGAYAKGAFAEQLALVDPKTALTLIDGLQDAREFDRHHGNMAHMLAGRDPAEAERLLARVRDAFQRDQYSARVVYRMAPADLDRARGIAAKVQDPGAKGYAIGMMAFSLAKKDARMAEGLLREAYDSLEAGRRGALFNPAEVGASLIAVAEAIDPKLVTEAIGRTLSLRQPPTRDGRDEPFDARVALMIARYDRDLAWDLLEKYASPDKPPDTDYRGVVPVALAVIDPRKAIALVEAKPEDPQVKLGQPKLQAVLAVANVLARPAERRWKYVLGQCLYLWVPDTEDIDADR